MSKIIYHAIGLAALLVAVGGSATTYQVEQEGQLSADQVIQSRSARMSIDRRLAVSCNASNGCAANASSSEILSPLVERRQIAQSGNGAIIRASNSNQVIAFEHGRVAYISPSAPVQVLVSDRSGRSISYGGLARASVLQGQVVEAGQQIGVAGDFGGFGPSYSLGRELPTSVFADGFQRRFQGDISMTRPPQFLLRVQQWGGRAIQVWLNGEYVAELNSVNSYTLAFNGMVSGAYRIFLIGDGVAGEHQTIVRTFVRGEERTTTWTNGPHHMADFTL